MHRNFALIVSCFCVVSTIAAEQGKLSNDPVTEKRRVRSQPIPRCDFASARQFVSVKAPDTIKQRINELDDSGVYFSRSKQSEFAALGTDEIKPRLAGQLAESKATKPMLGRLPAGKILFLGNSITLHGPKPDIGWNGNWGMAASHEDADYVHLITKEIAKATDSKPEIMVRNIADFERGFETFEIPLTLQKEIAFSADIVVVAIGENVADLATDEVKASFAASFVRLVKSLKQHGQPAIFVRSSFWANPTKDEIMRKASADTNVTFVDIGQLGQIEENSARSEQKFEHAGVAAHPGDKGMRAIAKAIYAAIQKRAKPEIEP